MVRMFGTTMKNLPSLTTGKGRHRIAEGAAQRHPKTGEKVAYIPVFGIDVNVINNAEDLLEALRRSVERDQLQQKLKLDIGDLVAGEGIDYAKARTAVEGFLKNIGPYIGIMAKSADQEFAQWPSDQKFDPHPFIKRLFDDLA